MTLLLGCIADDFTGGTDLSGMLVRNGLRTVLMVGVPETPLPADIDAVVIALKSRTIPAADAVAQSLAALSSLQAEGCRQIYFKYCSTFDSTPTGNIGPVAEALMDAIDTNFTIACPAFPANARTIYQGHLFVGGTLLSESGMRDHPLTPMTDANLVRVLGRQTQRSVGLVDARTVAAGPQAIRAQFGALRAAGQGIAIVDAVSDADLEHIGTACLDLPLVTAGSGVGLGLARALRQQGQVPDAGPADTLPLSGGYRAVIAGSCSIATQAQVAAMRAQHPAFALRPAELMEGVDVAAQALEWAKARLSQGPVLVYSTAPSNEVKALQQQLGTAEAGALIERTLAAIASGLVDAGVGRLIVAGGETSGAVVQALTVSGLRIGPEIDPGVPWTSVIGGRGPTPLALALKSGNFGTEDFFLKAWERLS